MRKLLLVMLLLSFVVSLSLAQTVKLCPKESGILSLYDFPSHSFYLGTRYPLVDYKGIVYLDCVAITDFSSLNGGLGVSLNVVETWKMMGLNVYLSDKINVGCLGGYNVGKEKWYWGPYAGIKLTW